MVCFDETENFFFFNDTAPTEIYTLSLHDALPISCMSICLPRRARARVLRMISSWRSSRRAWRRWPSPSRSEEHTSELQSRQYLVCRLLLEKKKLPLITHSNTHQQDIPSRASRHTV